MAELAYHLSHEQNTRVNWLRFGDFILLILPDLPDLLGMIF